MKTLIDISPERTGNGFRMFEIYPKIKDAVIIRGMHLVNYHPIFPTYPEFATPYQKLDLLKDKYPDAYVFYVDREKEKWIRSLYNHWVSQGGTLRFYDWYNNLMDKRIFETDDLIDYAKKIFGDNFYLLDFGKITSDPNAEFNLLLSHFGLDTIYIVNNKHNSSFNDRQIDFNRFLNKVHNCFFDVRKLIELFRGKP